MPSFFFRKLQLITVLFFIRDSHMSWTISFFSQKAYVEFSIFDSVSFLSKSTFWSTKKHESLFDFKTSYFQNIHTFAARPLIFKLYTEVLNFTDICVS